MSLLQSRNEAIRIFKETVYFPSLLHYESAKAFLDQLEEFYALELNGQLRNGFLSSIVKRMQDEIQVIQTVDQKDL